MKQFFSSILVLSLGFLPYMPLMHAEESSFVMHEHHQKSERSCDEGTTTPAHNMQGCIDAVHDILRSRIASFVEVSHAIVPVFPYWQDQHSLEKSNLKIHYKHSQDPPSFTSHSLVGIVKLTT